MERQLQDMSVFPLPAPRISTHVSLRTFGPYSFAPNARPADLHRIHTFCLSSVFVGRCGIILLPQRRWLWAKPRIPDRVRRAACALPG